MAKRKNIIRLVPLAGLLIGINTMLDLTGDDWRRVAREVREKDYSQAMGLIGRSAAIGFPVKTATGLGIMAGSKLLSKELQKIANVRADISSKNAISLF